MLFGALFFVLAAEMGCTKQSLDLRKNEGFVRIDLLWKGNTPSGSRFYFYPQEDVEGNPEPYSVDCPAEGFTGNMPSGTYKVIVHNSDIENLAMRNEHDYDRAEIYVLGEDEAAASVSRAGSFIAQPSELMLAAGIDDPDNAGQVTTLKVAYREKVTVTASPAPRVKYLRFLFTVDDASQVSLTGGSLSGVSPSLHCASASCSSTSEQVRFTVGPNSGSECDFRAEVSVLDLVQPNTGVHILTLTLLRPDGTSYQITRDLSATVNDILNHNGGTIPVTIPIDIPIELKKIGDDLKVDVGQWTQGTGGGTLQ